VRQPWPAPRLDEARAHHQRVDLFIAEHERRQVEVRMQAIADARLAVDRHARSGQVGDVAIDRAVADFEPLRELRGRRQAATAQVLHNFEQAIRTPHGHPPSGFV
jgi:hypothetical protein